MEQAILGNTGWRVPRLALGTFAWGTSAPGDEPGALLQAYVDRGGSLVEVSAWRGSPAAEEILGSLVGAVVPRSDLHLALVAGTRLTSAGAVRDLSRAGLVDGVDASLERLGVDHVDLVTVETGGREPAGGWTALADGLDLLVHSGRTHYVAIGGANPWQVARVGSVLEAHRTGLAAVSCETSLFVPRSRLRPLGAAAHEVGAGLVGWAPLGRGLLAGRAHSRHPADSRAHSPEFASWVAPYLGEDNAGVVDAVTTAARGLGTTALTVAFAWASATRDLATLVAGPRTVQHVNQLADAVGHPLPHEVLAALDDVSEGASSGD